jgi:hypothetical protein
MPSQINWSGEQVVRIVGTGLHEDTLRFRPSGTKQRENHYRLRLPTLCITYADAKFANSIGGEQARWPASSAYGPQFFDPPVVLGPPDIERLTWIRGAHRVTIGPKETEIEWFAFSELIVPRLRLSVKDPIEATVEVVSSVIDVAEELRVDVAQYANGRLIGGVQVAKRHPDWKPPKEPPFYDLWIRVIDGDGQRPLPKLAVALSRWDGKQFVVDETPRTDRTGSIVRHERKPGELEAAALAAEGWWSVPRVWRALPGQPMNVLLEAVRLKSAKYPGRVVSSRKVYAATYPLQTGETLATVAETFRYRDAADLLQDIGSDHLPHANRLALPGWYFTHAASGDTLDTISKDFGVARGWARTPGRRHRPDPRVPLEHEIVAVPSPDFVAGRRPR